MYVKENIGLSNTDLPFHLSQVIVERQDNKGREREERRDEETEWVGFKPIGT